MRHIALPDNPVERRAVTEQLNAAGNQFAPTELQRGTIGWVIQKYRDSDEYQALATGTVKYYERFLREIEALGPMLPFASFTRRALVDFIESYPKTFQRRQSAVVLKKFKLAGYHSVVPTDQTAGLRLKTSRPRDRIWTDEEIARRIEVDGAEDPQITAAFLLLKFTAQARETSQGGLAAILWLDNLATPTKDRRAFAIPARPRRPRSGLPDAEIEVRRGNRTRR